MFKSLQFCTQIPNKRINLENLILKTYSNTRVCCCHIGPKNVKKFTDNC
jgi:hypothetical protein